MRRSLATKSFFFNLEDISQDDCTCLSANEPTCCKCALENVAFSSITLSTTTEEFQLWRVILKSRHTLRRIYSWCSTFQCWRHKIPTRRLNQLFYTLSCEDRSIDCDSEHHECFVVRQVSLWATPRSKQSSSGTATVKETSCSTIIFIWWRNWRPCTVSDRVRIMSLNSSLSSWQQYFITTFIR